MARALFLWLLLIPAGFAAYPGFHTYRVESYPKGDITCQAAADRVGDRVVEATGVAVYQRRCEREGKNGYDLLITYVAEAPLTVVSTFQAQETLEQGLFATREACEAVLSEETERFRRETELPPVVAY